MNLKDVYDFSYQYLLNMASGDLTKAQIDEMISCPDVNPEQITIQSAYELMLSMLQDFSRYSNVINYKSHSEKIKDILHDYDLSFISTLDPSNLLGRFKKEFEFKKDTMWMRYSKGVVSGAKFLIKFKDHDEFISTLNSFDQSDMTRIAFALYLSSTIDNMGFAVACNWLKELGYSNYAKPDTHTKDICDALGLASKKNDIDCFEAIGKVAREAGVKAYSVDKVWWLICTGNFYRYNIKLPTPAKTKKVFISELQQRF